MLQKLLNEYEIYFQNKNNIPLYVIARQVLIEFIGFAEPRLPTPDANQNSGGENDSSKARKLSHLFMLENHPQWNQSFIQTMRIDTPELNVEELLEILEQVLNEVGNTCKSKNSQAAMILMFKMLDNLRKNERSHK